MVRPVLASVVARPRLQTVRLNLLLLDAKRGGPRQWDDTPDWARLSSS